MHFLCVMEKEGKRADYWRDRWPDRQTNEQTDKKIEKNIKVYFQYP